MLGNLDKKKCQRVLKTLDKKLHNEAASLPINTVLYLNGFDADRTATLYLFLEDIEGMKSRKFSENAIKILCQQSGYSCHWIEKYFCIANDEVSEKVLGIPLFLQTGDINFADELRKTIRHTNDLAPNMLMPAIAGGRDHPIKTELEGDNDLPPPILLTQNYWLASTKSYTEVCKMHEMRCLLLHIHKTKILIFNRLNTALREQKRMFFSDKAKSLFFKKSGEYKELERCNTEEILKQYESLSQPELRQAYFKIKNELSPEYCEFYFKILNEFKAGLHDGDTFQVLKSTIDEYGEHCASFEKLLQ